jgi:hypothetical protein
MLTTAAAQQLRLKRGHSSDDSAHYPAAKPCHRILHNWPSAQLCDKLLVRRLRQTCLGVKGGCVHLDSAAREALPLKARWLQAPTPPNALAPEQPFVRRVRTTLMAWKAQIQIDTFPINMHACLDSLSCQVLSKQARQYLFLGPRHGHDEQPKWHVGKGFERSK